MQDLFKNNLYLSKEWADFMNSLVGNIEFIEHKNNKIYYNSKTNKVIGLHNYSNEEINNKFLSQQFSRYFGINYKDNLIAGMIFWENKDNVYSSIAFSNKNYWYLNPNNFRLDYLIKYACENSKNIHLGIGFEGSGYEKFKESIGTIKLKCISSPKEFGLNLASKLNGLPLSPVYKYLSEKHERRIIELLMPF